MSKEDSKTKKIYKEIEKELVKYQIDFKKNEEMFSFEYNIEERGYMISYFIDVVQEDNYIELGSIHIIQEGKGDYVKGLIACNECNMKIIHGCLHINKIDNNLTVEYRNTTPYLNSDLGNDDISMLIEMSYRTCSDCIEAIVCFMNGEIGLNEFSEMVDDRLS